jgi:transposase
MKIRVVKTASNAKAVQVVRYHSNKRIVIRHFGSAHDEATLNGLLFTANEWLKEFAGQLAIFPDDNPNNLLHLNYCKFIGVRYGFFYDTINDIQHGLGFAMLPSLLKDLVTVRLFEPASKLRSIELLSHCFGIEHQRKDFYKMAPKWVSLKDLVEQKAVSFAKENYSFNYDLLFYDVTTLYFETFEEDGLRKHGFSKDNKSQQPQILIALMVNTDGFPISYEIFAGNTFEGHTLIPVIENFIQKNAVGQLTVVADAAMISAENVAKLNSHGLNYIVGARLGNLSPVLLAKIDKGIERQDGKSIRIATDNGYLVCAYSSVRYRKDKYEMEKQIEKAKTIIANPSKKKKAKFTKDKDREQMELNEKLIEKTEMLLGIKGYYTNLPETKLGNRQVIERYHDLYKIEQAFRISKSDLQTRPIFHFKEDPIKLHILICFMALVVSKEIEIKTQVSIRKFTDECKKVTDGRIFNQMTNKIVTMKAIPGPKMLELIAKITAPH